MKQTRIENTIIFFSESSVAVCNLKDGSRLQTVFVSNGSNGWIFCPDCSISNLDLSLDVLIHILHNPPLNLTSCPAKRCSLCVHGILHYYCSIPPTLTIREADALASIYGKAVMDQYAPYFRLEVGDSGYCVFYSKENSECRLHNSFHLPLSCQLRCCEDERIENYNAFKDFCLKSLGCL